MANTVNITVGADTAKAEGKLGGLGGKIKGLAKPVAVASAAVTGMAIAAVKLGDEFKQAENTIRAGTGATGEDLKALTKSFQEVFKGVPNDSKAVSTAIADLNTELGLQGKELENATKAFLDLSRVTGSDVAPMIKSVSDAMLQFGIPANQVEKQLDKLTVASQAVGVPIEQLSNMVNKFAPQLKVMGFSMDESTALIASMEAAGLETTRMFPGLNTAMKKMTDAGVTDLSAGLKDLMDSIKNTEDETVALALAQEAFGASAGIRFADAIRSGAMETDDLIEAMNNAQGTVDALGASTLTTSDKMDIMKNRIKSALAPIGNMVVAIGPLVMIIPALTTVISGLTVAMAGLNIAMGPVLLIIGAVAAAIIIGIIIWRKWDTISLIVTRAVNEIRESFGFLETALDTIKTVMTTTWDGIKTVFETSVSAIKTAFDNNLDFIMQETGLRSGIEKVKTKWNEFWDGADTTMDDSASNMKDIFNEKLDWLKENETFQTAIETLEKEWKALWQNAEKDFQTAVTLIKQAYESDLGWILPFGALGKAINLMDGNWGTTWKTVQTTFEVAVEAIKKAYKSDLGWLLPFGELVTGLDKLDIKWKDVWGGILGFTSLVFVGLRLALEGLINKFIEGFNLMVTPLNKFISVMNKLLELLSKLDIKGFDLGGFTSVDGSKTFDFFVPSGKPFGALEGQSISPMQPIAPAGVTVNVTMPSGSPIILDDEQSAQRFGDFIARQIRETLRAQGGLP